MSERYFRRVLLVLGHGVFATLLVLAWKYAILRSTLGDSAYQIFQWISQPGWDIEAHRYTAIVPQAMVKFCVFVGADLRTLLVVASLTHVAVGYAIFVLCAHVWRAQHAALGCAMAAVLCTRLTFYSPVLEANYLLCYPFLLFGFIEVRARKGDWSWRAIAGSVLLLLVPLLVHPAGWLVMVFGVVFLFVRGGVSRKAGVVLLAISLTWPLLARWLFPPTGYELAFYTTIGSGLQEFRSVFSWASWRFLSMHTVYASTTYLPALLVWISLIGVWIVLREWRIAVLTFAGPVAFVGVYLVTFHEGDSGIMLDRGALPVASILALSAAALVMRAPSAGYRAVATGVLVIVLFVKVRDVSFASRSFQKQVACTEALIERADEQGIERGIADCAVARARGVTFGWALPVESLLRSGARGHAVVLVCASDPPSAAVLATGQLEVLGFVWNVDRNGSGYFSAAIGPYRKILP